MLLLGLDLETGGEFSKPLCDNFITEVGLVMWDSDFNQPVEIANYLVETKLNVSEEAQLYTGISTEMLKKHGTDILWVLKTIKENMQKADYIVAHNGNEFDKPLLEHIFKRMNMEFPSTPWIDTLTDVPYPKNCVNKNLTYLAGFHKMLNFSQHRAVTDVLIMLEILSQYNLEEVIGIANSPMLEFLGLGGFHLKESMKKKGFRWFPEEKQWKLKIKKCNLENMEEWDFKVKCLNQENTN